MSSINTLSGEREGAKADHMILKWLFSPPGRKLLEDRDASHQLVSLVLAITWLMSLMTFSLILRDFSITSEVRFDI